MIKFFLQISFLEFNFPFLEAFSSTKPNLYVLLDDVVIIVECYWGLVGGELFWCWWRSFNGIQQILPRLFRFDPDFQFLAFYFLKIFWFITGSILLPFWWHFLQQLLVTMRFSFILRYIQQISLRQTPVEYDLLECMLEWWKFVSYRWIWVGPSKRILWIFLLMTDLSLIPSEIVGCVYAKLLLVVVFLSGSETMHIIIPATFQLLHLYLLPIQYLQFLRKALLNWKFRFIWVNSKTLILSLFTFILRIIQLIKWYFIALLLTAIFLLLNRGSFCYYRFLYSSLGGRNRFWIPWFFIPCGSCGIFQQGLLVL